MTTIGNTHLTLDDLTLSPKVTDCRFTDCFLALCKLFPFDSIEATISIDDPFMKRLSFDRRDCRGPDPSWDRRGPPVTEDLGPISGGTCPISVFLLLGWSKESTLSSTDLIPVLVIAFCEKRRKLFALANTGAVSGFLESLLRRSIFCSFLKKKMNPPGNEW